MAMSNIFLFFMQLNRFYPTFSENSTFKIRCEMTIRSSYQQNQYVCMYVCIIIIITTTFFLTKSGPINKSACCKALE